MVSNDHFKKKYGFCLTEWKIVEYKHYNDSKEIYTGAIVPNSRLVVFSTAIISLCKKKYPNYLN